MDRELGSKRADGEIVRTLNETMTKTKFIYLIAYGIAVVLWYALLVWNYVTTL
jgi:hypothetical protein